MVPNSTSRSHTPDEIIDNPAYTYIPGIYKDPAAPPIGGPALDDSGVETVQWREREGHDSYQEVEVYIIYVYVANIRLAIVALLWSGLGHIHILAMVLVQLKMEELAKVVVNRHLNPEDCSGMTWAESA